MHAYLYKVKMENWERKLTLLDKSIVTNYNYKKF